MGPGTWGLIIAAISIIMGGISAGISIKQANNASDAAAFQMNLDAMSSWRNDQMSSLQLQNDMKKFMMDMSFKRGQMQYQNDMFNQDMDFKQKQLEYELQQHEGQLQFENLQQMASIDYAGKAMKSAMEANNADLEGLKEQWNQTLGESKSDMFERKRQAMKEQAQIRVSQGESGIFGNTALKELSNSVMQDAWDRGIMGYNLESKAKQSVAVVRKTNAESMSKVNEAMSSIAYHVQGSMNGAYAGLTIG